MSFIEPDFVLKMINVYAVNLPTFSPMQAKSFVNFNGGKKEIILKKQHLEYSRFRASIIDRDWPKTPYPLRTLKLIVIILSNIEY